MPEPKLGANVLYVAEKGAPALHAVITEAGVDDEDKETKADTCWLTVFPPAAAPYATLQPVPYDADTKPEADTWHWERSSTRVTKAPAPKADGDKGSAS